MNNDPDVIYVPSRRCLYCDTKKYDKCCPVCGVNIRMEPERFDVLNDIVWKALLRGHFLEGRRSEIRR